MARQKLRDSANPRGTFNLGRYPVEADTVQIDEGETTSESIACLGMMASAVIVGEGFVGTSLTLQGSLDGQTFFDLYEYDDTDGTPIVMTVAASRWYSLPVMYMLNVPYLRFVADEQTADVTLTVVLG